MIPSNFNSSRRERNAEIVLLQARISQSYSHTVSHDQPLVIIIIAKACSVPVTLQACYLSCMICIEPLPLILDLRVVLQCDCGQSASICICKGWCGSCQRRHQHTGKHPSLISDSYLTVGLSISKHDPHPKNKLCFTGLWSPVCLQYVYIGLTLLLQNIFDDPCLQ